MWQQEDPQRSRDPTHNSSLFSHFLFQRTSFNTVVSLILYAVVSAVLDYLFALALIVSSSFCDVDSAPLFSGFLLSC